MPPWGGQGGLGQLVDEWARSQWATHALSCPADAISEDGAQEVNNKYWDLVWHCEDHQCTRLVGYCPQLYSSLLIDAFFSSVEVFRVERTTPAEAVRHIESFVPRGLRTACRWAFARSKSDSLPGCHCIPKAKK
eukprot:1351158-Pyramimonas_sp.AAC.1